MLSLFATIAVIAVVLFVLDRFGLWLESRGWIYWRKVKRKPAGGAAALNGFDQVFQPTRGEYSYELRHDLNIREVGDEDKPHCH